MNAKYLQYLIDIANNATLVKLSEWSNIIIYSEVYILNRIAYDSFIELMNSVSTSLDIYQLGYNLGCNDKIRDRLFDIMNIKSKKISYDKY